MQKPDLTKVIGKIKKMLALANASKNNHEAEVATAMMMAKKLMDKYNLQMFEIEQGEDGDDNAVMESELLYVSKLQTWKKLLTVTVKNLFNVTTLHSTSLGRTRVTLVGEPQDIAVAIEMYAILEATISKSAIEKYSCSVDNYKKLRGSYRFGFAVELIKRAEVIEAERKRIKAEAARDDLGNEAIKMDLMVTSKEDNISTWMKENIPNAKAKAINVPKQLHGSAYSAGRTDGSRVSLTNNMIEVSK